MNKRSKSKTWNVNVYIVTWNVGSKFPNDLSVNSLLRLDTSSTDDSQLPDFFVIGLQEVNSQPQHAFIGLFRDDPWTTKFKRVLRIRDYVLVKTEQLQGILVIVFAKRKHILHLRNIEAEYTKTGFGGIWGNKGAVSVRLNIYGCAITFINSHLAAHDDQLDERIEDYKQILMNHHYHVPRYREIFDHDYVFWFGDLNFRLTDELTTTPQEIRDMIEEGRISELLEKDQLTLVRRQGKAFHKLEEEPPRFPPTFKYIVGTREYDMKRRPAWTDRILYKVQRDAYANVALSAERVSYNSHSEYNISDHKPVTSEFVIKIYEDVEEKTVEFSYIPLWHIGEENIIEYTIPDGFEERSSDWIGVYNDDFSSLNDYVAYEYTNQQENSKKSPKPERKKDKSPKAERTIRRMIHLEFSENIDLKDGQAYILLYFQSSGLRGISGLAGMSNVFRAERRPPSPRFEAVD